MYLRTTRRRFAGAERRSSRGQIVPNPGCERVRDTKHTPRGPLYLLERRHGLADIVERGVVGFVERHRVICPHPEREFVALSKNALHHGYLSARQRLGFFVAL